MISDIRGRTRGYSYLHAGTARTSPGQLLGTWLSAVPLTGRQKATLLVIAVCMGCATCLCSALVRGGIASVRASAAQVEQQYLALENEHLQLLSARAQLSSRERIGKMAETRFQLFEPTPDQVQKL